MKKSIIFFLPLVFSSYALAALDAQSWTLEKGEKHASFSLSEDVRLLEADVFSELTPFQKRWSLVSKVASLKNQKQALVFLEKCLRSDRWFLQSAALKKLVELEPKLASTHASRLLKSSKALVVRSAAVETLARVGSFSETEVLWQALRQKKNFKGRQSLWIRPQIVKTIYKLEAGRHVKARWESLLNDSDPAVKTMARRMQGLLL